MNINQFIGGGFNCVKPQDLQDLTGLEQKTRLSQEDARKIINQTKSFFGDFSGDFSLTKDDKLRKAFRLLCDVNQNYSQEQSSEYTAYIQKQIYSEVCKIMEKEHPKKRWNGERFTRWDVR